MQPKGRMTFRFDPPQPAPRPQQFGSRTAPAIRPAIAQQVPVSEDRAATASETPIPDRKAYYAAGPLQDDLYSLEDMIRNTEPILLHQPLTVPAMKPVLPGEAETFEERFDSSIDSVEWSPPQDSESRMEGWLAGSLSRREGPSWWRVFASVAGAVATGALFGYLVLTLFTGDPPFPAANDIPGDTPAQASPPSAAGAATAQDSVSSARQDGQAAQGAQLAESSFYLLQYGVFGSEESMNSAVKELQSKGLASAVDRTDGFRVYAGAAESKEEADRLAGLLTGLEVYVKPSVGGSVSLGPAEGGAELAAFMARSAELTRRLSRLSIKALQSEQPTAPDAASLAALRESHGMWAESVKSTARLSGKSQEAAKAIQQNLNAAMVSLDEYSRKTARFHLWSIQSDVMQAVINDRAMRAAIQNGVHK